MSPHPSLVSGTFYSPLLVYQFTPVVFLSVSVIKASRMLIVSFQQTSCILKSFIDNFTFSFALHTEETIHARFQRVVLLLVVVVESARDMSKRFAL